MKQKVVVCTFFKYCTFVFGQLRTINIVLRQYKYSIYSTVFILIVNINTNLHSKYRIKIKVIILTTSVFHNIFVKINKTKIFA